MSVNQLPPAGGDTGRDLHREGKEAGDQEESENGGDEEPTEQNRTEAAIEFAAGTGGDDEGHETEETDESGHEDRSNAGADAFEDGAFGIEAILANVVQGLFDDQDRVIDDGSDEDDETEHRQDVQLLDDTCGEEEGIQATETGKASDGTEGYAEDNDEGV